MINVLDMNMGEKTESDRDDMKYMLLLSTLELGGAERQAVNFAEFLKNNMIDVTIIGMEKSGEIVRICEEKGICCRCIEKEKMMFLFLSLMHKLHLCPSEFKEYIPRSYWLKKYVKHEQYDVCISYCAPANTVLGIMKSLVKSTKPLCIWYQRDSGIYDKQKGLQKKAINSVDYILANSISGKNWLYKAYKKDAELVYNGVIINRPERTREEWRSELGLTDEDLVCTMIANLTDAKDHMFLLRIWKTITENKMNYKLLLGGKYGNMYPKLKEYVEINGLEKNVFFLGQVSDISGLIMATDICVFSAISEGSPNGIIEPAICGLPVVATDLPEIREVLSEENCSLLFKSGDMDSAIKNIKRIADDKDLGYKIGMANKEKAKKLFSSEINFRKIIDVVENENCV